jgi:hypothetical protein
MMIRSYVVVSVVLLAIVVGTPVAAADPGTPVNQTSVGQDGGNDLREFFLDALSAFILVPIREGSEIMMALLLQLIANYPDVKSSHVLDVHSDVFSVSVALATVAIIYIGLRQLLNQRDGVRSIVYILGALGAGAVAPYLLAPLVRLSRLLTSALLPSSIDELSAVQFTLELALVGLINALAALGIGIIFVIRDVYLQFGVAAAPFLFLIAVTPYVRRIGQTLIYIWVAFLFIGPLDAIILDLALELLKAESSLPHWLWVLGTIVLMLGVPIVVLGAGVVFLGPAFGFVGGIRTTVRRLAGYRSRGSDELRNDREYERTEGEGSGSRQERGDRFDWRRD